MSALIGWLQEIYQVAKVMEEGMVEEGRKKKKQKHKSKSPKKRHKTDEERATIDVDPNKSMNPG